MLPNDYPPYQTVYYWFRRLMRRMLFRTIHDLALMLDRLCNEREVLPSAGIVDSQSVKAPAARTRGYDANKKLSGRKRHIAVDTDGRLLAINLTPADIADSTGAQMVLDGLIKRWPWVKCGIRPQTVDGQGRVSRLYSGSRAASAGAARFRCSAKALGGRANVRMADALPAPGARLRTAH